MSDSLPGSAAGTGSPDGGEPPTPLRPALRPDGAPADPDDPTSIHRHDDAEAARIRNQDSETAVVTNTDGSVTVIRDDNPQTLIDERRTDEHPRPFGRPGRPLSRSPFYYGFFAALGVFVAYVMARAIAGVAQVILLVVISLFLAVGLNPLVELLMRAGLRRGPAVGCVFLGTVLVFAGVGYAMIPPLVNETSSIAVDLPGNLDRLLKSDTIRHINERFGLVDAAKTYVAQENLPARVAGGVLGLSRFLLSALLATVTVLILTLYFLAALPQIKREVYALVPASRRTRVSLLGDEILLRIGSYVSGMVAVSAIAGAAVYVFLRIIDVPYSLPLAIVGGLLSLVPMVGATIALVVLATVSFFTSVEAGVAVIVYYIAYQQLENYVIYPRIMRRSINVPPAITVVAALAGGTLMGVVGALLAIPAAAAALLIVREVIVPRQDRY